MSLTILRTTMVSVAFILGFSFMQANAMELDLSLDSANQSSLTELSDSDYKKLREMAGEALNSAPDGSSHQWVNYQTGNRGMLMILSTRDEAALLCRDTEFVNTAGGLTSSTLVTICKQENGEWKADDGSFDTSSEVNQQPLTKSTSQSVVVEDNVFESTEIRRKTIEGVASPEYCRELSETMRTLKINPEIHMNTAIEYKEKCIK